jgi:hypothetical protein
MSSQRTGRIEETISVTTLSAGAITRSSKQDMQDDTLRPVEVTCLALH